MLYDRLMEIIHEAERLDSGDFKSKERVERWVNQVSGSEIRNLLRQLRERIAAMALSTDPRCRIDVCTSCRAEIYWRTEDASFDENGPKHPTCP